MRRYPRDFSRCIDWDCPSKGECARFDAYMKDRPNDVAHYFTRESKGRDRCEQFVQKETEAQP